MPRNTPTNNAIPTKTSPQTPKHATTCASQVWRHRRHTEFDKDLQNIIICAAGGTFTYRLVALAGGGGLLAFLVLTCWHYVAVGVLRKVYGVPLVTPGPLSGTGLDGVDDVPLPGDE